MERSDTTSLRSEIEYLKAQVQELRQSRDQAHRLLEGLERLAQQTLFWDGTPERLAVLAAQIRQAFDYRAVSMVVAAPDAVCCRVVDPPGEVSSFAPAPDTEPVWQGREPCIVSIADQDRLLVPLADAGRPVGRVEILLKGPPTQEWVGVWRTLSIQLAAIVTQGTRFAQIRETQRRQQLVYDITRHLSPDLSLEQMLSNVLELTIPYADADAGSVMLLDDSRKVVSQILTRRHLSRQEQAQVIREVMERGLARWVLDHEEATIITDTETDSRWLHLPQDETAARSVLAVPLRRGTRISALLFLVHRDVAHFNEGHMAFLSSVADQLAMATENAYLLEQTRHRLDELALLNEISQATSSLQLNDVLRIVTQRIVQALHVRRCAVFLLDEQETHLVLRAIHNPDVANDDMNLVLALSARPHIAEAVRVRSPVEITDVLVDERLRPFWEKARRLDIGSQLAVPLIARQRVIGAISIDRSTASMPFTQGEIDLCQTIAHQAANAIENAQLYQELQRRADLLGLVNKVSHDIGAILDTNVLLWEVVHLILETLHCYYVAVGLIEGDQLVFRAGINHTYQPTPRIRLPMLGEEQGIAIWVARTGRSLLVPDVLQDERFKPLPGLPDARSELAVPLKLPGRMQSSTNGMHQVVGVLDVQSTLPGAFSVEDQNLLESLAAQVTVAIESAELFGRMREERAALEAILNGTDDAIIVTDPTDRILFFNPAAQQAFLDGERPLAGDSFAQVVKNEALLDLWREPTSKEANAAEIPMSDGRTFNASLTVIPGVGRVAVMQDITYLKETDKIKSEFVSTVSHDLRSPLQVIQTSAELLPRMGELNLDQRKEVDHILAVVRRMADLVQNLLDIGRIEAGIGMEVEPCAIDEIIAGVAGSFRTLAQSHQLDLTIDLPKTLPLVYGNRLRLEQVISNLLQNAIKFTPEGTVSVVAWSENGEVIIEVNDTGIGIPPEAQDALFQKFYRVNSPLTRGIQGTGLGLAIVKSIVENYRGKIEVKSVPRLGSTFRVTFPMYGEEQRLPSEHLPYENSQHQATDRELHQAG